VGSHGCLLLGGLLPAYELLQACGLVPATEHDERVTGVQAAVGRGRRVKLALRRPERQDDGGRLLPILSSPIVHPAMADVFGTTNSSSRNSMPSLPRVMTSRESTTSGCVASEASLLPPTA
jgi:hypothetical protein